MVLHPGEIINQKIRDRRISQTQLAIALGTPQSRIQKILSGERGITADTAIRLGKYFDTEPIYWLTLQAEYEIAELARTGKKATIENMVRMP